MTTHTVNFNLQSGSATLNLTVDGIFFPEIRGSRDRWGAPEEPDEPAHWEIQSIIVDGVEVDDFDQFLESLEMSWKTFDEICTEKFEEDLDNW